MKDAVRAAWEPFNKPLEGRVQWMYLDVKGFVSTGVGNLIDASRTALTEPTDAERTKSHQIARALPWQIGEDGELASDTDIDAEWDLVKSRMDMAKQGGGAFKGITTLRLSDEAIDELVFSKLDEMEGVLKSRGPFTDFDTWPADAQLGLLSMSWGMGPKFNFPKFQAAVASRDWTTAAAECRFNPEIGTIVERNDRDQQLFRNAATVEDGGLDPEVLLFEIPSPA
jgi:hypothetical protein